MFHIFPYLDMMIEVNAAMTLLEKLLLKYGYFWTSNYYSYLLPPLILWHFIWKLTKWLYVSNAGEDCYSCYTREGKVKGERGTEKKERKKPNLENKYLDSAVPGRTWTYHKHGSFSDSFSTSSPCSWYILLCLPIRDTSANCPYRLENRSVPWK